MQVIETLYPSEALRPYIQYFLFTNISREVLTGSSFRGLKTMPCTFNSMVLFFTKPSFKIEKGEKIQLYEFGLAGFNTSPNVFRRNTGLKQMIICFSPIGLQCLLDFPLKEINNSHAPVKDLFQKYHEQLLNELCSAESNPKRVRVFEGFYCKQLKKLKPFDKRVQPLLNHIYSKSGTISLASLSCQLGIGERTIQRIMRNYVGVNFKLFSRLVRFRSARLLIKNGANQNRLTEIAYQLGYFDQAHFIHDFQSLSGMTPGNYMEASSIPIKAGADFSNQLDTFN